MLKEYILGCDRCGRIIDGKNGGIRFVIDDEDVCATCYKGNEEGLTYLDEFEIDAVYLDKDNEAVLPQDLPEDLEGFTLEKINDAEYMEYAFMWSVYQRVVQGGVDCIADFATEDEAISFKIMLEGIQRLGRE